MRTIGIIPARYASTRFPGKPLVDIFGKPMIQRVYESVKASNLLDEVWVATDDERIVEVLKSKSIPYIETSNTIKTGTERIIQASKQLKTLKPTDIVINIQGDEPFISKKHISLLLTAFQDKETQIASLRKKIEHLPQLLSPNTVKVVCDNRNFAHYFSRSIIPYVRDYPQDQWMNHVDFYKHIGIYGFRFDILTEIECLNITNHEMAESLEQLTWLDNSYRIKMLVTEEETPSIDTPKDLELLLRSRAEQFKL
ncbi:MAG: 3-deoxy-manno-octulosonate cytidylyltransferase [Flavobacteriales bacterium]